jgi:hypothetical protein
MSELDYIGAGELVFHNDPNLGIGSGGFSVNSIMLKGGMSPIMTINTEQVGGEFNKVSDLFNDLVVPNWTLSYNSRITGGKYKEVEHHDSDSDDDVIDDDLHDKLLELVKEHNIKTKENKKKMTRKNKKSLSKKGGTKKNK